MTDKEMLEKVWNFVTNRLEELNKRNDDSDYDWGRINGLEEVLNFMDEL